MKSGLEQAYELVMETSKEGTVKTNLTPGGTAAGEVKKAKDCGPESTGVKKPVEGEEKINPGHGKIKTESKEIGSMLPTSKFDALFKQQLVQEDGFDESPVEMEGDGEFDDETGDFPEEVGDETGEEVDVATEIRMIIDRLTEIAEKLGAYDDEEESVDGIDDELDAGGDIDDDLGTPVGEAVSKGGPGKGAADGKIKPFKNNAKHMQSKSFKVKSAFNATGKKASCTSGPGKGPADGKLNPMRKTTFGPKMSQKAEVKGTMGKPGTGIFDNI